MRALLCLVAAALLPAVAHGESTLRLRVAWGGETPVRWVGQVSLSEGELRDVDLLSRERDAPGSIWLTEGAVRLAQPRPRRFDGFDITAAAPLDATLRLEFQAAGGESSTVVEAKLSELMRGANRSTIGLAGTTLLVHRAADDALRVDLQRDNLIFATGETMSFGVEPVIAGAKAGSTIDLVTKLYRGRRAQEVWSSSNRASLASSSATKIPVEIPLPDREGVYTVELIARTPPGNRSPFWGGTDVSSLAARRFQIVVLGARPLDRYVGANWQTLLEIDPANPSWWNRLPDWTRIDRLPLGKTAQQAGEPFRSSNWQGKPLAELPRSGVNNPKWRAYPLPAAKVGLPHVVEVELPADSAQRVSLHIYESDSDGKLTRNGPGTGIVIDDWPTRKPGTKKQLKYLFWPRTNSPLLVVQNASEQTPARYGVVSLRVAQPSAEAIPAPSRLVAARFTWAGFLDRCGARATDSKGQPAIDDWVEFYTSAHRLAELLELNGYNGALLNVLTDGGAAFDLGNLPTTPVLNSNRVASGANDLPAVEPLDLLMRIFSRRGLRLAPTLNFSASLPSIEASLRDTKFKTLEEYPLWTDLQNRPRTRVESDSLSGPAHYRISHSEVQQAVTNVVERLVQQVSGYSAFAGVGIELGPDSYLTLPPSPYGMTPTVITKFAAAQQTTTEVVANWRDNPQNLLEDNTLLRQWNAFRAQPGTEFFATLAGLVTSSGPDRSLLLLTDRLLQTHELNVRPALSRTPPLEELYMERGVAIDNLQAVSGLGIAPVLESTTGVPLADAAVAMELSRLAEQHLRKQPKGKSQPITAKRIAASMLLPTVDGRAAGQYQQSLWEQSDNQQNKPLIDALRRDPGGPLIVGSSEGYVAGNQSARRLLTLVQQLPTSAGDQSQQNGIDEQPVAARTYQQNGETLAVALNSSPWPINVTVTLDTPTRTTGVLVNEPATTSPGVFAAGKHAWATTIEPFSARAIKFASSDVTIAGLRTDIGPEILDALSQRYAQLERLDLNPQNLPPYLAPPNPSFEQRDVAGNAEGWMADGGVPTVESDLDGAYAAKLLSLGDGAAISTEAFDSPETGQLAITAYVRAIDVTEDSVLRLVVEEADGSPSPRFIELTGKRLLEEKKINDWTAYRFGVEDLPLATTAKIRVRFELEGVGEVWVDNLQFHDLVYPLNVYETESQQQVFALVRHLKQTRTALDEARYSDCLDLLDSYWSQFMLKHLPEIQEPEPSEQQIAPNAPATESSPTPRLTDRVRDLFRF